MVSMSGAAFSPAPQGPPGSGAVDEDDLFASALVASNPPKRPTTGPTISDEDSTTGFPA